MPNFAVETNYKKMNKKIFTLLLGITLSLPFAFTSCSSNNNNNNEENTENTNSNADSATMNNSATDNNNTAATTSQTPVTTEPIVHAVGNNMAEMHYDVTDLHFKEGDKIHLTLINDGSDPAMIHNIVISKEGTMKDVAMAGLPAGEANSYVPKDNPNVIANTKMAKPGETVTVDFTAPAAGTYDFFCSYPGHYTKMNGKVTVDPK
jgi:azurin